MDAELIDITSTVYLVVGGCDARDSAGGVCEQKFTLIPKSDRSKGDGHFFRGQLMFKMRCNGSNDDVKRQGRKPD